MRVSDRFCTARTSAHGEHSGINESLQSTVIVYTLDILENIMITFMNTGYNI